MKYNASDTIQDVPELLAFLWSCSAYQYPGASTASSNTLCQQMHCFTGQLRLLLNAQLHCSTLSFTFSSLFVRAGQACNSNTRQRNMPVFVKADWPNSNWIVCLETCLGAETAVNLVLFLSHHHKTSSSKDGQTCRQNKLLEVPCAIKIKLLTHPFGLFWKVDWPTLQELALRYMDKMPILCQSEHRFKLGKLVLGCCHWC